MSWLVISIALSVVLTVLLNVGLRVLPGARRGVTSPGVAESVAEPMATPVNTPVTGSEWPATGASRTSNRRVRVWMPWKAMIVGSLLLTILLNLVLWITRA